LSAGNTLARLESTIPLLRQELQLSAERGEPSINAIAFPDDGAAKRFRDLFDGYDVRARPCAARRWSRLTPLPWQIIICGKVRDGENRIVTIQDGDADGKHVLIVDDLVQTGGTLFEAGKVRCRRVAVHAAPSALLWHCRRCENGERSAFLLSARTAYSRSSRGSDSLEERIARSSSDFTSRIRFQPPPRRCPETTCSKCSTSRLSSAATSVDQSFPPAEVRPYLLRHPVGVVR
jgi:hypothetical protein